jgi:hypothetical protein
MMIRRLIVLLALAGAGWYVYTRFFRQPAYEIGDTADLRPDDQRNGFVGRVSEAASGAASTARRAAQAPVAKVRSLVGGGEPATPEGERVVLPEGSTDEDAATEIASGYAPADERREPPPTPDMYRPAAEGAPSQASAPRQQAGATVPAESGTGEPATAVAEQPSADQSAAEETAERTIKGNVRPDGEKIYHLPNDPSYARTNAEQWFASVEEAEAAGYRRAGRPRES